MPRFIMTPALIAATLVAAPISVSLSAPSPAAELEATTSDLYSFDFDDGDVSGWATVRKTQLGVAVVVHATGLTPGNAYVLRAAGDGDADYLSGNVAGRYGTTTFLAHLGQPGPLNESADWLPQMVLGDAGAATPEGTSDQLLGLSDRCATSSAECFQLGAGQ